jgi:hypothetical protein
MLGKYFVIYGGQERILSSIPVAAKNHILVPVEYFDTFEGFKYTRPKDKETEFLNYWPELKPGKLTKSRVLSIKDGFADISDVLGNSVWDSKNNIGRVEKIEISPDGTKYIIVSESKVYLMNNEKGAVPYPITVSDSATWSADSEFLYWIDDIKKTSFIYDIENEEVKELGDYYFKAVSVDESGVIMYTGRSLYVFKKDTGYKRIVLTNAIDDSKYAFIDRNGKTVVSAEISYSPDKTKILYSRAGGYYYISNLDGTRQIYIGMCNDAQWIDNDKIFIREGNKTFIYSRSEKISKEVKEDWHKVGQTIKGDVFFMKGSTLYCESDSIETKVMTINGGCDYVYALSSKGPYIVVSIKADNLLFIGSSNIKYLGKYSQLIEGSGEGKIYTDFDNNIMASPDKKKLIVMQRDKDFVSLNVINSNGTNKRTIFISHAVNMDSSIDGIKPTWLTDDVICLYSGLKLWIVDLKGDTTKVYEAGQKDGDSIQGILQ